LILNGEIKKWQIVALTMLSEIEGPKNLSTLFVKNLSDYGKTGHKVDPQ